MRTTALLLMAPALTQAASPPIAGRYHNPLKISAPDGSAVEVWADPSIIRSRQSGDPHWYLYGTAGPHTSADINASNHPNVHLMGMARSRDLVSWEYVGDVFASLPDWVKSDAELWAPDIQYLGGQYLLYYAASDTKAGGSALGVAVSKHPAGPWSDSGRALIAPHAPAGQAADTRRWLFDPAVVCDKAGQAWLYYGSYFGGLSVCRLSADGLSVVPGSEVMVASDNRYEGAQVTVHDNFFYLTASATDCCRGPLSGYSVFAGRAALPTGPFLDREGASLLSARVGGTPMLSLNGNRWVGPGHHALLSDAGGQDWVVYHAIDRHDPYVTPGGVNKRRPMLDPLDWVDGWPQVRAGRWASDQSMPAPATQPGEHTAYTPSPLPDELLGKLLSDYSDDLSTAALGPAWRWVRPPVSGMTFSGAALQLATQNANLREDGALASVLLRAAPPGDYAVQVKLKLNVPLEGCFNSVQGGLLLYQNDERYLKLAVISQWNTRQIEWAKAVAAPPPFPRYGNTVLGAPGETTWLRIVSRSATQHSTRYTAYASTDGAHWVRGGTWTHNLGAAPSIGLVSMGGAGFESEFSELRVYALARP